MKGRRKVNAARCRRDRSADDPICGLVASPGRSLRRLLHRYSLILSGSVRQFNHAALDNTRDTLG